MLPNHSDRYLDHDHEEGRNERRRHRRHEHTTPRPAPIPGERLIQPIRFSGGFPSDERAPGGPARSLPLFYHGCPCLVNTFTRSGTPVGRLVPSLSQSGTGLDGSGVECGAGVSPWCASRAATSVERFRRERDPRPDEQDIGCADLTPREPWRSRCREHPQSPSRHLQPHLPEPESRFLKTYRHGCSY